jgi:hypothetical protein
MVILSTIGPEGKKGTMKVEALVIKGVDITVGFAGDTTIAVANLNGTQGIGMAVCMEGDKYSEAIGTGLAAGRAIKHIGEQMERVWNSRAITKEEYKNKHKKG